MSLRLVTTSADRPDTHPPTTARSGDSFGPADIGGTEAIELVITVYGVERLAGRGHARISDRALRDAVRRLAAEARARDAARCERMLIALRQAWLQMPAIRQLSHDSPRAALWDRLVTIACEEFYGATGGHLETPRAAGADAS